MYRVKQFVWALTGSFKKIDMSFLKRYLNEDEINIFKKLKLSEQHHCIRVCMDSINIAKSRFKDKEINYYRLGKAALLHDVGKIECPLNVIEKSIIVVLDRISSGSLNTYTKFRKVDSYYNHPKNSVKILSELKKYDKEFLDTIKFHHSKKIDDENIYLNIIKHCDDLN
ncbi:HD domain-containing protein [uncultured Clostridium sp.]|uniref:HD domain-containing protein n=1 Tax=uncultured Clostridium sp. TaxID=59620 RepID=UPI00260B5C46|nr:HD domain-containing protein [uncultured Clostridium sp.]